MFTMSTASTKERKYFKDNTLLKILAFLFLCTWCWTLIDVADMTNWALENVPVLVFIIGLVYTYQYFKFSDLSYLLIFVYLPMHIYGAKYTYAENPLGYYIKDLLNLERNHYDRIVHFVFGFLFAYILRDLFLNYYKFSPRISIWMPVIWCLAIGGFYEILEGAVVGIFFPEQGANFLGIQGDFWDPQKDIFLAGLGASVFAGVFVVVKKYKNNL